MECVMRALGVDVSVARGLDLVMLDERRHLVGPPLRRQTAGDLVRILRERKPDIVAIDSPPKLAGEARSRSGERALRALGIRCYFTPSDGECAKNKFYDWMRAGFAAFEAAAGAGYPLFGGGRKLRGSSIEVFPHGSAVALRGLLPASGTCHGTSRKRRWRAAVLEARGVSASGLRSPDEVDAALAALTGVLALEGEFWTVGDSTDGFIVVAGGRPDGPFPRERAKK
jgi:predicted nuclease with RNAse H fold